MPFNTLYTFIISVIMRNAICFALFYFVFDYLPILFSTLYSCIACALLFICLHDLIHELQLHTHKQVNDSGDSINQWQIFQHYYRVLMVCRPVSSAFSCLSIRMSVYTCVFAVAIVKTKLSFQPPPHPALHVRNKNETIMCKYSQ